jgi:hypothetical protein
MPVIGVSKRESVDAVTATWLYEKQLYGPVSFSDSGWCWWLTSDSAGPAACEMDVHLSGKTAAVTLLGQKEAQARFYYRIDPQKSSQQSAPYFAKRIRQKSFKRLGALLGKNNSLMGVSHGTAELAHNLALARYTHHGIDTYAFGEFFRFGLPAQQLLIQEYLEGWTPFGTM